MQHSERYEIRVTTGGKVSISEHETEREAWDEFDYQSDLLSHGSVQIVRLSETVIATRSKA